MMMTMMMMSMVTTMMMMTTTMMMMTKTMMMMEKLGERVVVTRPQRRNRCSATLVSFLSLR